MPDKKKGNNLIEGSHYHIKSLSTKNKLLETSGHFRGYVMLGRAHALKIELDEDHDEEEGSERLIPCHMVTQIDIIEEVEEEEDDETSASYYG